ncbi:hypothetical protein A1Q1_03184 [Trichosporon asahii var. asahii CBS 2479]|uniref:BZIP domain-containing protein n=1 Tax=Trichosporon asahii var. asahii (strain ATCC 90039 / CBS 2479 / JCM 2466 / KCTC 7840 / NBRC 103889/ NCYC 2677 / UAMH 7654) TaxID=1186058 RepID=J6ETQ5_TRIAS|nr:hypothetical protein A1Q1_03184 [Trichosporon asahii var. asahii CBS 2479]EJT47949.1 hypothetical protein A1Q1_03184 [Trichosporon asahii var. asahii CBS 2479]
MAMNDVDWANIFAALGGSAPAGQQSHPQAQHPLTSPSSEEWPPAAGVRHTHSTSSSFSIAHDPPRGIGTAADIDLGFYWPQSTHHGQAHPPPHPHPHAQQHGEWPSAPGSTTSSTNAAPPTTAASNPAPPPPPPTTPATTRAAARTRTRSAASTHTASTGSGSNTPPAITPALTPIAPAPPGNSRRGSTVNTPAAEEEDVEDKRVRNTLASARFRAKKKLQLEATERAIKSLEGQAAALEVEVGDLRKENGLLRDMVGMKYRLQQ